VIWQCRGHQSRQVVGLFLLLGSISCNVKGNVFGVRPICVDFDVVIATQSGQYLSGSVLLDDLTRRSRDAKD